MSDKPANSRAISKEIPPTGDSAMDTGQNQPDANLAAELALLGDDDYRAGSPSSERGSSLLSEPIDMDISNSDFEHDHPTFEGLHLSPIASTPVADDQAMSDDVLATPTASPPPASSGAVAPSRETSETDVSHQENNGADASNKENTRVDAPQQQLAKLCRAIVRAHRASSIQAPAKPAPRKRGRLTLQTHHTLPDVTPQGYHNPLSNYHPWAQYITQRSTTNPSNPDFVTSAIPLTYYPHIAHGGYLSTKFVRSLFPRRFKEEPSKEHQLPIFELMRPQHAIQFRRASQQIITALTNGRYTATENTLPVTPANSMPSEVLPAYRPHFPVLYQVVCRGPGQGATLEAKDFFIPGPDRHELHLIKLDQFATNLLSNTRGFDRSILSVKDFVWVYAVEPTPAAIRDPEATLAQARVPKASILDNRTTFFFRVKEFVFVTPPATKKRTYGIVLSLVKRYNRVKTLRIAFESAPEAVAISPTVCDFPLSSVEQDEIVTAFARRNVSTAMRFSGHPVSKEAQEALCEEARKFSPAHPEEGLLPLQVFRLTDAEKEWIDDRAGEFLRYRMAPAKALRHMAQLFNAACSALVATSCINEDRGTHSLTATVPSMDALPMRFDFTISDMSSEAGWTNQRLVYLWIVGSRSLIRASIQQSTHSFEERSLSIRVTASVWQHRTVVNAIRRYSTTTDGIVTVPVCVKLGVLPTGADPVYEIISSLQLFQDLSNLSGTRFGVAMDIIYGNYTHIYGPVGRLQENTTISIAGNPIQLRPDQVQALQMGLLDLPVLALQAAFGTGKTVMGALIAGRIYSKHGTTVIATTTTNTAVAQFTETLLKLDEFKNLDILRYVSDSALTEGTPRTAVDMPTILKGLVDNYGHLLDDDLTEMCRTYKHGRKLLETYLFEPERSMFLSEADREEYRLAERDVSGITKDVIAVMFAVRRPAIVCLTTAALLNAVSPGGIFSGYLSEVRTVLGDEASQIPEPAMVAVGTRLPNAHLIYIGDNRQLEPHVRCPRNSNAAKFGALGVMDLLLAKGVPTAQLTTTFRAHPELNSLPNQVFYDGQLVSGTEAADRQLFFTAVRCPNPKVPFLFVDIPGTSVRSINGSHSNDAEAEVCRQIVMGLLSKKIQPGSIAIIVFYKEQFRLLEPFAKRNNIDIHTVDSVQGREKDIVVLLSTKTGPGAERGDFLDDPRRLNVALTRCRHGQFVLGHEASLSRLHYWRRVIDWARSRNAWTTATSIPDLLE